MYNVSALIGAGVPALFFSYETSSEVIIEMFINIVMLASFVTCSACFNRPIQIAHSCGTL